ncbi:MAG TPA: AraC family transcriptional regulator [Cyclobacteriaceae bacterium]|jgi:AraC-like DNA-binding protein|nr:AraC family transcriptional regulator [Cyclobacteriaceae bacterium]HRK53557.1 AraC family transcriptional regulator [Cyclobacteriaceae bacterium]
MKATLLEKNTQEGIIRELYDRDEIALAAVENKGDEAFSCPAELKKNLIHFYFCMEGSALFEFGPHYSREIQKKRNYFFYNPESDLPFRINLAPDTRMVFLTISLKNLHELFLHDTLPFLKPETINRKFYDEREIPASLMVVLNQLSTVNLSEAAEKLYYQGKVLELLSLYFSERKADTESCPFLNDEETVRKIKRAKELLLKNSESPPRLKELAKMAGLNEYQLKVGFKQIYGNTVFGFLLDHKLDNAQLLLDTAKFKVNEVAYQIGYTNPSHFIAAFKKKYGVTPKKYLMSK